jgi:hypothetical protein
MVLIDMIECDVPDGSILNNQGTYTGEIQRVALFF